MLRITLKPTGGLLVDDKKIYLKEINGKMLVLVDQNKNQYSLCLGETLLFNNARIEFSERLGQSVNFLIDGPAKILRIDPVGKMLREKLVNVLQNLAEYRSTKDERLVDVAINNLREILNEG